MRTKRTRQTANPGTGDGPGPRADSPLLPLSLSILLLLAGCSSQTGPDANPQVFKTPEQAQATRKAKLLLDWQEMTERFANADRPDISTTKAEGFAVKMSADGVDRTVDLTPLHERLTANTGKEREPIRAFLAQQFPELDRARLKKLGFDRAAPMFRPMLANMKRTAELTPADAAQAPVVNRVVIDLNWIPAVNWPGSQARTAIDADVLSAWGVPAERVNAAALENLRKTLPADADQIFETTELPGLGRYGSLRADVDPAILLLPDFLAAVRKAWNTADDLVISFPSMRTINFCERKNEKLLKALIPTWQAIKAADPMITTLLLDADAGLSLCDFKPTEPAKPATVPTTKRVYIVN